MRVVRDLQQCIIPLIEDTDRTFFEPQDYRSLTFDEQLEQLEQFWESEVSRVGEPSSLGWKYSVGLTPALVSVSTHDQSSSLRIAGLVDPYTRWANDEQVAERRMPVRSGDPAGDDPYSTILFSDIKRLIIDLVKPESRNLLKRIWLSLLGLHLPGLFDDLVDLNDKFCFVEEFWPWHQFRRSSHLDSLFSTRGKGGTDIQFDSAADGAAQRTGFGPVKNWRTSVLGPLENIGTYCSYRTWEREDVYGVDAPMVRRLFELLKEDTDPHWDALYLAFEAALDIKK